MNKTIILLALVTALGGCGSEAFDDDCSHYMDDQRDATGAPEEVNKYRSGDYHSETWWYWSRGFSRTFTWQDGTTNSCEISDYTFPPIR